MSSPLGPIAAGVLKMFAPLDRALHDPDALRLLLYDLGWEAEIEAALLAEEPYASLAAEVADLIEQGTVLVADLTDSDGDNDAAFEALVQIIGTLRAFVADLSDVDEPPPGITDPGFWAQLALDLPEYLIVRYLERYQAVLYGLLRLGGVIEDDPDALAGSSGRKPYVRRRIDWDNLVALIGGPADHLQALYHWADGRPFDHARLLDELARFGGIAGVRFERLTLRRTIVDDYYGGARPPDDVRETALPILSTRAGGAFAEQGVLIAPVPPAPSGTIDGLYVTNLTWGQASAEPVELAPGWTLTVTGSFDATGDFGAHLRPGVVDIEGNPPQAGVEIAVEGVPVEDPWRLLGMETGPRVELNGLRLALRFDGGEEPDVTVSARALPNGDRGGIALTIDPADGDSFLQRLIPASVRADADPELRWSARDGLSLSGGAGLDVVLPIDKSLGPLKFDSLHLRLTGGGGAADLLLALTGGVSLPPLEDRRDGRRHRARARAGCLRRADRRAGRQRLVQAARRRRRHARPRAGGERRRLRRPLPGHRALRRRRSRSSSSRSGSARSSWSTRSCPATRGWALFASISATFPGLPLGFGFLLSGVGGIFALNRTMDVEALASGLKSGAADAILFPEDPAGDCRR